MDWNCFRNLSILCGSACLGTGCFPLKMTVLLFSYSYYLIIIINQLFLNYYFINMTMFNVYVYVWQSVMIVPHAGELGTSLRWQFFLCSPGWGSCCSWCSSSPPPLLQYHISTPDLFPLHAEAAVRSQFCPCSPGWGAAAFGVVAPLLHFFNVILLLQDIFMAGSLDSFSCTSQPQPQERTMTSLTLNHILHDLIIIWPSLLCPYKALRQNCLFFLQSPAWLGGGI